MARLHHRRADGNIFWGYRWFDPVPDWEREFESSSAAIDASLKVFMCVDVCLMLWLFACVYDFYFLLYFEAIFLVILSESVSLFLLSFVFFRLRGLFVY